MGNSPSLLFVQQHFPINTYQWKPFSPLSINNQYNNQKILIDQSSGIIAEKYLIRQFQSLEFQLNQFLFRKLNSQSFVTVYDIQLCQTPSVILPDCMTNQHNNTFTVILQRISYRLADIGVIKFQEMIYILQQCFKGLQLLWIHSGRNYMIDEDTICFNSKGNCKISVNEKLFKNTPNIDASFLAESIIQQLFQTLECRLCSAAPQIYYRMKLNTEFKSFIQALNFVQKIRNKFSIQIDSIQSLKEQTKTPKESDSLKAIKEGRTREIVSQQKRADKYSLKNSRNMILNKLNNAPKTILSKQHTTDVSVTQLQRINGQDLDGSRFLRSTFKSVRPNQNKKSIQFTQYSQKTKPKISPKKVIQDKSKFKQAYSLSKVKKGPLFN